MALLQDSVLAIVYDMAPRDIEEYADGLPSAQRGQYAQELQNLALSALWRSVYLDTRYGAGCGDQGHDDAVKAANKALAGCRKVLGFTYPERANIRV